MRKTILPHYLLLLVLIVTLVRPLLPSSAAASYNSPPEDPNAEGSMVLLSADEVSPFFAVESYILEDGTILDKDIITGPPQPPPGFEAEREASLVQDADRGTLASFPAYNWVFGCSAVSAAMIAGYYDRTGYPNMYTGPTDGGVMPLSDSAWPYWQDSTGTSYVNNPLVASKKGVDGRGSRGTIENYWVSFNSTAPDPYITYGWLEHTWGTAIGDYMKTSQSGWPYQSRDGSTWFWNYSDATKLTCCNMELHGISGGAYTVADVDGTYGRKRFYEARGYTVDTCYNQRTDNRVSGGFSMENYKAEIHAGHPVLINLQGHSIVGFGYSDSTIYIRDAWDSDPNKTYSMPWGGSYHGMAMNSVSIVRPIPPASAPPVAPQAVTASEGTFSDKIQVSWNPVDKAAYYRVFRNAENQLSGAVELTTCPAWSPFDDRLAAANETFFYWVKACNSAGCSDYSVPVSGWRNVDHEMYLPLICK